MSERSGQPFIRTNAVISSGLASAAAAVLTSRFGMAGTLLGAAITSMIITGGSALVGFYIDRAAAKARDIPPKVQNKLVRPGTGPRTDSSDQGQPKPLLPKPLRLLRDLFSGRGLAKGGFLEYSNARRRTAYGVLLGVPVSFLIGLAVITSLEFGASKSLSCWVWERCPEPIAATPASYAHSLQAQTRPTIFGGGAGNDGTNPPSHDGNAADQYAPATP